MKPEPLYVFRDKKDRDDEDGEGEDYSRPASSQRREGEESKDASQKPDGKGKEEKSYD